MRRRVVCFATPIPGNRTRPATRCRVRRPARSQSVHSGTHGGRTPHSPVSAWEWDRNLRAPRCRDTWEARRRRPTRRGGACVRGRLLHRRRSHRARRSGRTERGKGGGQTIYARLERSVPSGVDRNHAGIQLRDSRVAEEPDRLGVATRVQLAAQEPTLYGDRALARADRRRAGARPASQRSLGARSRPSSLRRPSSLAPCTRSSARTGSWSTSRRRSCCRETSKRSPTGRRRTPPDLGLTLC